MSALTRRTLLLAPMALAACTAAPQEPVRSLPTPRASAASGGTTGTAPTSTTTVPTTTVTMPATAAPSTSGTTTVPAPSRELPRGGRVLFPEHRLVGFCGVPGSPGMGRLGIGRLSERITEIERLGSQYADGRTPLPVLELIVTVVQGRPGRDGLYRSRIRRSIIDDHLAAARDHKALLLLNIQPGRATFPAEVRAYEEYLRLPEVGIALDPEWRMGPGQVPMKVFGSVTAAELNEVGQYVSDLVKAHDLPEKALVVHQLAPRIIRDEKALRAFPGVAWIKSVDGIGAEWMKRALWDRVVPQMPKVWHPGFKLFYEEDAEHGPLMTPAQVMALRPAPEYVMYE